jgi:LemA protein
LSGILAGQAGPALKEPAEALATVGTDILVAFVMILVLVGGVLYFVILYNSLVRLRNDVDKAWANVDVLLRQRHDELPKLIETCKAYMLYEQNTFQLITDARVAFMRANTTSEKARVADQISGAIKSLFAVAENYPDLKADNSFLQLQERITELEEKIADRREFFNDDVNTYNIRIQQIPDTFVAGMLKLRPRELFKATEEDRPDVEVKLT